MQLSETVKLYMTGEQKSLIVATMTEYINTVNSLVSDAANGISISKYTTELRNTIKLVVMLTARTTSLPNKAKTSR